MADMASASKDAKEYHTQVQNITKNLGALNAVYEMELNDANSHLKAMNKFYSNVASVMESMEKAGRGSEKFSDELHKLTGNLTSLNGIYGSMLTAMKGGGGTMDGVAGVRKLNLADGLHPTAEGHEILADNVLPALRALLIEVAD